MTRSHLKVFEFLGSSQVQSSIFIIFFKITVRFVTLNTSGMRNVMRITKLWKWLTLSRTDMHRDENMCKWSLVWNKVWMQKSCNSQQEAFDWLAGHMYQRASWKELAGFTENPPRSLPHSWHVSSFLCLGSQVTLEIQEPKI